MRGNILRLTLLLPFVLSLAGCLTLFSKTEIHRSDEQRLPIQFESGRAGRVFQEGMSSRNKHVANTRVGIPFVTFYAKEIQLGDNAFFNEQVRICDTNQDGVITEVESNVYAGRITIPNWRPDGLISADSE